VDSAVDTLKSGAFHYMKKPFKADALRVIVKLALQTQTLKREVRNLKRNGGFSAGRTPMIGNSSAFKEVIEQVREIARVPSTVLVTGESGTGKELVARAIHDLSDRRDSAFVAINCASIPPSLLESELFGHEKGSFTSATSRKFGLFEESHHGTIFLDEIGEMDMSMQAKLLRVLQERVIRRVGGVKDIAIDVRVVAATNRNLQDKISSGQFREDLFYRLNVFPIHIPPLRQRSEDIPALAAYFLDNFSRSFNRNFSDVSPDAARLMSEYGWPGNIRELRNVIERICIMRPGPSLLPEHLPQEIRGMTIPLHAPAASVPAAPITLPSKWSDEAVANYERAIIKQALSISHSNVLQTAARLGIPRGTLR
jgi:DNA-binding NtrC family response regulator